MEPEDDSGVTGSTPSITSDERMHLVRVLLEKEFLKTSFRTHQSDNEDPCNIHTWEPHPAVCSVGSHDRRFLFVASPAGQVHLQTLPEQKPCMLEVWSVRV